MRRWQAPHTLSAARRLASCRSVRFMPGAWLVLIVGGGEGMSWQSSWRRTNLPRWTTWWPRDLLATTAAMVSTPDRSVAGSVVSTSPPAPV